MTFPSGPPVFGIESPKRFVRKGLSVDLLLAARL